MKKFDKVVAWGCLITIALAVSALVGREIFLRINPYKLDHKVWVQYNPSFMCNQEPIWGPGDNGDEILGWHLVDDSKVKRFMFIKLNNVAPPNNAWIGCNGYQSIAVPYDMTGMNPAQKEAFKNKRRIFYKFIDCMNGGSTIISSETVEFAGTVEIPVTVWQNGFQGVQPPDDLDEPMTAR